MKRFISICILLIVTSGLRAQKIEYQAQFQGIGDNREFTSEYNYPQTILGERASLELGTTIDSLHRFRVGINQLAFGRIDWGIHIGPHMTQFRELMIRCLTT